MAVKNGLKFFDIKGRIFNLKKNHSWLTLLFSTTLCLASYCHWGNSFSSYFSTNQYILLKFFISPLYKFKIYISTTFPQALFIRQN